MSEKPTVFYCDGAMLQHWMMFDYNTHFSTGWYWSYDHGEPSGPFDTKEKADLHMRLWTEELIDCTSDADVD